MIKEDKILIKVTSRNKNIFIDKGYDVKYGEECEIKVSDLSNGSHYKITAICDVCGDENRIMYTKYIDNHNRYGFYGCKKCSNVKRERTSIIKWGVSNYRKTKECDSKIKSYNLEKYGVEHTFQIEDVKNRIKETNLKKYGSEYHLSSKIIRKKIIETNIKRYGVDSFSKTELFYKKTYDRWENDILEKLDRYDIKDFELKSDRTVDIKCDRGKEHYFNINSKNLYQRKEIQKCILCTICNNIDSKISGQELLLLEFIRENTNFKVLNNVKDVIKGELDIYIPKLKLAFEFNGIYWHSDLYKGKYYHFNKTEMCEEKGIQLIHIYEDEWLNKQDIVKSIILNKMGKTPDKIYARKCEIMEIKDNKLVRRFLETNHIQGFVGSKLKIGLFYNKELYGLMTFGNNRRNMGNKNENENIYEMIRFCSKLNTTIIGGAGKLLKYFIKKYNPIKIITYADRSYSNGNLYKMLNFKFVKKTVPNYNYYDSKMNKYNRFNLRKDVLIKMGYDKNLTGHEIVDSMGYYRVYNSGNLKYEMVF